MKKYISSLIVGILFGIGLAVAGMTDPANVVGFLDLFGDWKPQLALVMVGAIGVHMVAYRIKKHKTSPFFDEQYLIPTNRKIDKKLLGGAAIFGIGWGLAGYCPGPAITALASGSSQAFTFFAAMVLGMYAHYFYDKKFANDKMDG